MVNREIIRTKIVQLTYAYYVNGNSDMNNAEKELLFSLSKAYELYLQLLKLIIAIRDEAENQWTLNHTRVLREGEGVVKRRNFIDNRFVLQLKENEQLAEATEKKSIVWNENADVVKHILELIEESEAYKKYMSMGMPTYADDLELWRYLYKNIITNNDAIDVAIEDGSLYWNDDKYIVDTFVLKTIRNFKEENGTKQPLLEEYRTAHDKAFALKLFRATIENCDEYREYMAQASQNWDMSRLSLMDVAIMQIALAEMVAFPEIAVHVTINEYIELAKLYSTPKSAGYINGMLDAIARMLIHRGVILKTMR